MFKKNYLLDSLQLYAIGYMLGNALFVGMGNIISIVVSKQDVWFTAILSIFIGILPVLLICIIMNYAPDLNLFEKIKKLFGKPLGFIFCLILSLMVFYVFILNIWQLTIFAHTEYLTETPYMFLCFMFLIPIFYSSTKGMEAIGRTAMIFLYLGTLFHIIVTAMLARYSEIENLKPILVLGSKPIISGIFRFLCYTIIPMITLLSIPKNKIKSKKNTTKAIIWGYISASVMMAIVFYMSISTVGYEISHMYRFPEYFILKKISLGQSFDNLENFFSSVWVFDVLMCAMMSLYFLKEYIIGFFKKTTVKKENIISFVICFAIFIISPRIFTTATTANRFMDRVYPYLVGIPFILIVVFIVLRIKLTKKQKQS